MDNPLLKLIGEIIPVSPALKADFNACLFSTTLRRKEILHPAGRVCNEMYFVVKGLLRAYYDYESQEITNWFMREGDFAISIHSFFGRQPSTEAIQALEPTEVLHVSYDDLERLYQKHVELNIAGRLITTRYMLGIEDRYKAMRKTTALERYQYLMETKPYVIVRAANKYIATYLGINLATLSRLKRDL